MTSKEIELKLKSGSKLIIEYNSYFENKYYIDNYENRIKKNQFDRYKIKCKNKDESQNNEMGVKGKRYFHFYWL